MKHLNWCKTARQKQITPKGDWNVWLILAGRGWGKTRTGAQDVAFYGLTRPNSRIAIVTPTFGDGRDTCIEGVSGLLGCIDTDNIENWNIQQINVVFFFFVKFFVISNLLLRDNK